MNNQFKPSWALYGYTDDDPYGKFLGEGDTKEDLASLEKEAVKQGYRIQYVHADGTPPDFKRTVNIYGQLIGAITFAFLGYFRNDP